MIDYGMFTDAGNREVAFIVKVTKDLDLTWPQTYALLQNLSDVNPDRFGEATDTAVREAVYDACGFQSEFYVL